VVTVRTTIDAACVQIVVRAVRIARARERDAFSFGAKLVPKIPDAARVIALYPNAKARAAKGALPG